MKILAIDIGTSTIKSGMVDDQGNILSTCSKEIDIHSPEPGAALHDPNKLFETVMLVSRDVIKKTGSKEIDAMVFSGYLFGLIPLNEREEPIYWMMTWLDKRPSLVIDEIVRIWGSRELYERTGCPPLFIYQLSKIYWLRKYKKEIFEKTKRFLDVKGFIVNRIAGRKIMDISAASGSQLLNIRKLSWDDLSLEIAGINEECLPELVNSDTVMGYISEDFAKKIGLDKPVPLVPGVFDGAAVAIGEGATSEGIGSSHLSTSTMLRVASKVPMVDRSEEMRFQTYYMAEGIWLPGGAVNNAGIVLRWFRDNFGDLERIVAKRTGDEVYELLNREAERAPPGSSGLVFLPYISGERFPGFGNYSSGVLFGLRLEHKRWHIIRALMEGVILNLNIIKEALTDNGLNVKEIRVTGGGAKSKLWLQVLADITGIKVRRFKGEDAALLGSCILAMKALGERKSIIMDEERYLDDPIYPNETNRSLYDKKFQIFKKLIKTLTPIWKEASSA